MASEHDCELLRRGHGGYLPRVGIDELDFEPVYSLFDLGLWWDPVGIDMWARLAPDAAAAYLSKITRSIDGPPSSARFERFDPAREVLRVIVPRRDDTPPV